MVYICVMRNYITMFVALVLVSSCSPRTSCDEAEVSKEIVRDARPDMGPREKHFWVTAISDACEEYGVATPLCVAKIAQESAFNQHLVSVTGARCAAQIMPMHYKSQAEIKEIEPCLKLGAAILANELKNCGTPERALRCYYAGPTNSRKGTLDRFGPYDLKGYSDGVLARVTKATAKACPAFNNLLVVTTRGVNRGD